MLAIVVKGILKLPNLHMLIKKNFMAPFYGWGPTVSRLKPLQGDSLLFITRSTGIPGTHLINLGKMEGWIKLCATQWFWTRHLWIGNPAPYTTRPLLQEFITSQKKLVLGAFGKLLIVLSTKANLLYLLYSTTQRCCILHLMKQYCLLKTFLKTLILMTWVSLYLFVLLELIWNCIIFI